MKFVEINYCGMTSLRCVFYEVTSHKMLTRHWNMNMLCFNILESIWQIRRMLAVEFYTGFNILRYFSIKYNLFDFVPKSICLNVDRCEMCRYWAVCKYMYNTSDKNINFIYISRFSFVFQCHHPKICNISQLNE